MQNQGHLIILISQAHREAHSARGLSLFRSWILYVYIVMWLAILDSAVVLNLIWLLSCVRSFYFRYSHLICGHLWFGGHLWFDKLFAAIFEQLPDFWCRHSSFWPVMVLFPSDRHHYCFSGNNWIQVLYVNVECIASSYFRNGKIVWASHHEWAQVERSLRDWAS